MKRNLRFNLSVSYILITLLIIAIMSIYINNVLEIKFREYTIGKQEVENEEYVTLIAERYKEQDGHWDADGLKSIGINALKNGIILKIYDINDRSIWDATLHNKGYCTVMLSNMADNMQQFDSSFVGGYMEKDYIIMADFKKIGTLKIGYYGPYFYSDFDLQFIGTLNDLLIWAAIISIAASLVLGTIMARRLSRPISRVIDAAQAISKGRFKKRIKSSSKTHEITSLTDTVNTLAETLENQDKIRKQLTSDIAHELRTPVATVQSHLEAMIDGVWEPTNERLVSCHEDMLRLSNMIGNLRKLSDYDRDDLKLDYDEFDLSVLIRQLIKSFEAEANNKVITVLFNNGENIINADRAKLWQVFSNLIANALRYTPQKGEIKINITHIDNGYNITIADNGLGIPKEDLPFIFERFYKVDKSRSSQVHNDDTHNVSNRSVGIGLSIVRSLVRAHKGYVSAKSIHGNGSIFTVWLPVNP